MAVLGRPVIREEVPMEDLQSMLMPRVNPPDAKTPHCHIHIYDSKGNPLEKNLGIGNRRDPNTHIQIKEP